MALLAELLHLGSAVLGCFVVCAIAGCVIVGLARDWRRSHGR
jgi:hypothetical protein